jgi:hypothetical protein
MKEIIKSLKKGDSKDELSKEQIKHLASFGEVFAYELKNYLNSISVEQKTVHLTTVAQITYDEFGKHPQPSYYMILDPFVFELETQVFDNLFLHIDRNKNKAPSIEPTKTDLEIFRQIFMGKIKEIFSNVVMKKFIDDKDRVYNCFGGVNAGIPKDELGVMLQFLVEASELKDDLNGGCFNVFISLKDYLNVFESVIKEKF